METHPKGILWMKKKKEKVLWKVTSDGDLIIKP